MLKQIHKFYCVFNLLIHIKNCISNEIFTICALYYKFYEKFISIKLNCHIFSFSSISIKITLIIEKRIKWHRIFRFCFFILNISIIMQKKIYRKYIFLYFTKIRNSQYNFKIWKNENFSSTKNDWHEKKYFVFWINHNERKKIALITKIVKM